MSYRPETLDVVASAAITSRRHIGHDNFTSSHWPRYFRIIALVTITLLHRRRPLATTNCQSLTSKLYLSRRHCLRPAAVWPIQHHLLVLFVSCPLQVSIEKCTSYAQLAHWHARSVCNGSTLYRFQKCCRKGEELLAIVAPARMSWGYYIGSGWSISVGLLSFDI